MGSKSAGPGGQMGNLGGLGQSGGDVQPFDMPPMQQAVYNPYTMTTDADMGRQAPPIPGGQGDQQEYTNSTMRKWIMQGGAEQPRFGSQDMVPIYRNELSPEQLQRYNEYRRPGYERYLDNLYREELGRKSDQAGRDFWLQQMTNGMSRDQVRQMFDQSEEGQSYNKRLRPMIDDFSRPPTVDHPTGIGGWPSPEMFLRQLYEDELGRAADQSGMDFWRQQMTNGMSRDQVRQWFDQSEEGQGYNKRLRPMVDDFSRPPPAADTLPAPMPPRAPIERPIMPPEVVDALRLATQGQQQPPMGQTPMPAPQQRGVPHPAAQSDAPQIARALRIMRGRPVY